jgi:CBS domain containing-hemolysin-like protein
MIRILKSGHSRVPVFDGTRQNVRGQMLVKTLILLDPKEATPVADIPLRSVPKVSATLPLYDMLNEFQTGQSHLVTVHAAADESVLVGIITIEDVIEELIQEEIVDETDVFVDVEKRIRVARIFQSLSTTGSASASARPASLGASLSTAAPGIDAQQQQGPSLVSLNDDPEDPTVSLLD